MGRKALLAITIFAEGGLGLLGLVLMRFSRFELSSRVDFSWSATAYAFLLGIPMLGMLFFFDRSSMDAIARFRSEIDEKIVPIFTNVKLPDLIPIAITAGVGEELFFRGWLQSALTDRFEALSGILLASAVFGLMHYLSAMYAFYAGLTGLYLGVIYQATGNLYIVVAIHALYDFIAFLYLLRKRKDRENLSAPL